jgi:hypothetical protein
LNAAVAGMPCTIEATEDGAWVVTIAASTVGRGYGLAAAIFDAGGGVVSRPEAAALAAAVEKQRGAADGARGR